MSTTTNFNNNPSPSLETALDLSTVNLNELADLPGSFDYSTVTFKTRRVPLATGAIWEVIDVVRKTRVPGQEYNNDDESEAYTFTFEKLLRQIRKPGPLTRRRAAAVDVDSESPFPIEHLVNGASGSSIAAADAPSSTSPPGTSTSSSTATGALHLSSKAGDAHPSAIASASGLNSIAKSTDDDEDDIRYIKTVYCVEGDDGPSKAPAVQADLRPARPGRQTRLSDFFSHAKPTSRTYAAAAERFSRLYGHLISPSTLKKFIEEALVLDKNQLHLMDMQKMMDDLFALSAEVDTIYNDVAARHNFPLAGASTSHSANSMGGSSATTTSPTPTASSSTSAQADSTPSTSRIPISGAQSGSSQAISTPAWASDEVYLAYRTGHRYGKRPASAPNPLKRRLSTASASSPKRVRSKA